MGMKEIVTALCATPPLRKVVVSLAKSPGGRRFLTSLSPRRGVYESFQDAWSAAKNDRHAGHGHPEAIERHVWLATAPMPSDYPMLYWLGRIPGDIRLFDYGGNMGNVYYSCAKYIDVTARRLEWTVYDLPDVISLAKECLPVANIEKPHFTASLQDAASANVLLVSGMYHYWEKDTLSFIEQFPTPPEHVFINRTPYYKNRPAVVAIQSTMKFAFPIIIRNVNELIDGFATKGYEIVDQWTAPEYGHVMPFFPEHSMHAYSGFYFRLKSAQVAAT